MATNLKFNRLSLLVPTVIVLIACNNNAGDKTAEKKDSTADTTMTTSQVAQPKATFAGATLDALYTDATSFKNLPQGKRVIFVLTFINPDITTLSGWPTSNGSYDDDPQIQLKKGSAGVVLNQDTAFVGNVMLDQVEVKRVKDSIATTHATFVLFTPRSSSDPKYRNHIVYDIFVTQDDPALVAKPLTTSTGVSLNPSPPKTN